MESLIGMPLKNPFNAKYGQGLEILAAKQCEDYSPSRDDKGYAWCPICSNIGKECCLIKEEIP
jgi:hypothetical protein